MDAVDEHHAGHVSRIGTRVHVGIQGSGRFRDQHVRRRHPCRPQESMQIASLGRTIARVRAEVAPAGTCPIIPARRRGFCQFSLNPYPAISWLGGSIFPHHLRVRQRWPWSATFKYDCGLPRARAVDIERAAADIRGAANLGEELAIPRTLCLLVKKPGDDRDHNGAHPNDQAGNCCCSQLRSHRLLRKLDSDLLLEVPSFARKGNSLDRNRRIASAIQKGSIFASRARWAGMI